ncbi:uncharacterized protein B0H18DRAFT_1061636 [Fomitopsis serialis]|uniref:uncharacterized protein n=1 Tax=Fomitopsis serialis TaxID=139415 RepID=UPI0020084F46|nr:uncharacterized protein B0H18DRAFT_1061636 [Neoantrodia serialis]KAH9911582.1 hypothetical protein B0H18DRAFT_1061636 [Neoantrodia serialis]
MPLASTSGTNDVWEQSQPDTSSAAHRVKARAPAAVVRDSWDDDDDDGVEEEENSQALWENANRKAPMPELVVSGSGNTFQPTLKILKRPTGASSSAAASPPSVDLQKSFAEREAQYQAARQRIFNDGPRQSGRNGLSTEVGRDTNAMSQSPPAADVSVKVLRAPRGPSTDPAASSTNSKPSRGFAGKRGGRGAPRG